MNKKAFWRFTLLLGATALLFLVSFLLLQYIWPSLEEVTYPYLSVFVLVLVILLIYLTSLFTVTPQLFVQIVIAGTAVKLLLFGAYNFYMIYSDPGHALANVLFFFVGYVLFTILEITSLFRYIRQSQQ
ncbi:hypothetical protein [Fulvivirga sedimenti]|uniref:Uncharacterized protein n=1 Tax=Fulvivirga sedimenti TaxID=2879465 RepID=A0A9X1HWZ9_9BACT|nr:hypothetical protein [Fulvivirga sedimenti]MCA6078312.1 hypothetical protein [Fulvivirga sedimenti]